jgi:hypothetical protein
MRKRKFVPFCGKAFWLDFQKLAHSPLFIFHLENEDFKN